MVEEGPDPCEGVTIEITGTVTDETNLGDEDGAIDISVTGGTEPYTYDWSNDSTTQDLSDLAPGNYVITVTDDNGCDATTAFTVEEGVDPCEGVTIVVAGTITDESTDGANDGAIDASATGGTGNFTYSWDSGQDVEDISGLAPGDYTLTATDENGCSGTATFTVEAGAGPCDGVTITVTGTVTDESTDGANDGAIDATVSGGTGTYSYAWDSGQDVEDISGLAPGDYTLTATDGNGCTGTETFTVAAGGTVGVNEISTLSKFNVYPNPVAEMLYVDLQFSKTEEVQIQIVDLMGRTVVELQTESVLSKTYSIQPELSNGVYFLRVSVGSSVAIEPFVVQ